MRWPSSDSNRAVSAAVSAGAGAVGLEIGVVGPDFPAHAFLLAALKVVGRNQLVYQSLGMRPAEAVLEDVKLSGAIADDGQAKVGSLTTVT